MIIGTPIWAFHADSSKTGSTSNEDFTSNGKAILSAAFVFLHLSKLLELFLLSALFM